MQHVNRCGCAGLRCKGADWLVCCLAQLRVGLPALSQPGDRRSDEVAMLDALGGADIHELLGDTVRGGFGQPGLARQFRQSESVLGATEYVEERERALENTPATTHCGYGGAAIVTATAYVLPAGSSILPRASGKAVHNTSRATLTASR